MSFFDDDEGGAPRPAAAGGRGATQPRPRRPQRAGGNPRAGGNLIDHHTVVVRRRIAAGVGVVLLVVIVLLINGCLKSGKEAALEQYNREAGQLAQESDQQVSRPLFATLSSASGEQPLNVEQKVNQLRGAAQHQAEQARRLSVPGGMEAAQHNLTLVLNLREEALGKIASLVRQVLGGQGKQASAWIAGGMEMLLSSDVIYSQRVAPLIQQQLAAAGIHGLSTAGTQFLPNLGWLEPTTVEERLTGKTSGDAKSGQVAPGTHGSALKGVSVGSTTLEPESTGTVNHLSGGSSPTFKVMVEDSGSNSETDVKVEVTVTAGGKQLKDSRTIAKTEPGVTSTASVPVEGLPLGAAARVVVYVQPVPGETNVENNKGTYLAVFEQ